MTASRIITGEDSTRRNFLGRAAGAAAALVAPAAATGARGDSRSAPIDTHMHVWSLDTTRYPFHPPEPNYRRPTEDGSVEIYLEEMKKGGVDFAVLVQERSSGWNNGGDDLRSAKLPQLAFLFG